MTQGNLAADLVLQASLEQRTLEKGLERREGGRVRLGWSRAVGLKLLS